MKILKIKLKNFNAFYENMNKKELTIDFTTMNTPIGILIGPNGSCKTFLLSMMTPFSGVGNLDVRNDLPLIRKGKKGYKYIEYQCDMDNYKIEHYYNPNKDTHSVKSYIKKNDIELNINGNVSSFLACVKEEFGLTIELLKIIRIGNNVQNIIKTTPTKRKEFIANQLEYIEDYLNINKNATDYYREYESILNYNINQISKLNIISIEDQESTISKLKIQLDDLLSKNTALLNDINVNEYKIKSYGYHNMDELLSLISDTDTQIKEYESIISSYDIKDTNDFDVLIDTTKEEIQNTINKKCILESSIDNMVKESSLYLKMIDEYTMQYNKLLVSKNDMERIDSEIKRCELELKEKESILQYKCDISEEELRILCKELNMEASSLNMILVNVDGFHIKKLAIDIVSKYDREGSIIYLDGLKSSIVDMDSKIESRKYFNHVIELCKTHKCNTDNTNCDTCGAKIVYDYLLELDTMNKNNDVISMDDYNTICQLVYHLYDIIDSINDNKYIQLLPDELYKSFTIDKILDNILNGKEFYPIDKLNTIHSILINKKGCIIIQDQLNQLKVNKSHIDYNEEDYNNILHMITSYNSQYESTQSTLDSNRNELTTLESNIIKLNDTLEVLITSKSYSSKYHAIKEYYDTLNRHYREISSILGTIYHLKEDSIRIKNDINQVEKVYNNEVQKLETYKSLIDEQVRIEDNYNKLSLIRKATSIKEGIPLKFTIQYMQRIRLFANDILSYAFDGTRRIGEFDINERDFYIEYFVNNTKIQDVKYASQGEEAFLTIAISLAIMMEAFDNESLRYNILLLDEVDGPLDISNRQGFIKIITLILKRLGIEQCFVITHNDMFQYEPCTIIKMKDDIDISSYRYATELKIK